MSSKQYVPNLMDEYPLLVYPSLAKAMGINKSIVFQQLHFLLCNQKTAKNDYVFIDGKWWVYNTYEEWQEGYFSWLSEVTLKRIFIELEKDKIVISRQSVKNKSDRRKWYSIDYEVWNKMKVTMHLLDDVPSDQNDTMVDEIILIPSNGSKVSDGYSETTTDTATDKKSANAPVSSQSPQKPSNTNTIKGNPPNGTKKRSEKLTPLQLWLARLPAVKPVVSAMLTCCYEGWDSVMMTPENSLTVQQLEKYICNAEEYVRLGGAACDVGQVYEFIGDVDYVIAPQTIAGYYLRWKASQQTDQLHVEVKSTETPKVVMTEAERQQRSEQMKAAKASIFN